MQVSLEYAQEHLSELVSAANRGEEVEIAQPGAPVRLVVSGVGALAGSKMPRKLGGLAGMIRVPTDQEWDALSKEVESEMLDSPLMTLGEI